MTSPIQLLLIILVSGIGIIALARMGKPLVSRLSILAVVVFGVLSVANPDLTTQLARRLGLYVLYECSEGSSEQPIGGWAP